MVRAAIARPVLHWLAARHLSSGGRRDHGPGHHPRHRRYLPEGGRDQTLRNRDIAAMQLKLDEGVRATASARDALPDLVVLDEKLLDGFRARQG